MKRINFTLLLLFIIANVFAQEYAVTGKVIDTDNNGEGLPLAQVQLLTKDSINVATVISDNYGYFVLKPSREGEYLVSVKFLGYETLWKRVKLTVTSPQKKMGQLQMKPDSKLLRELNVTGLAQELTIKADTFVYHSNAYRIPKGASLAALIKQLPGLQMDEEGNLTFQGKSVGSILINGKPFFGDANTAMSNMTSDAVEDVKVYEKTDEEKEFTGLHDTNKQTVIDLKIKKEYMSSWNINSELAGGTSERFLGKLFASNFNDKYRVALYAQANNLNQIQRVDENGNWSYFSLPGALRTYRTVGGILAWNNGKKNTEGGYLDINAEVKYNHENTIAINTSNVETLMGGNAAHYAYSRNYGRSSSRDPEFDASLTWNIDTLNRIRMSAYYYSYNQKNKSTSKTSTYNSEPLWDNAYNGLIGDIIDKEAQDIAVYSYNGDGRASDVRNGYYFNANYTRRLTAIKGAFSILGRVNGYSNYYRNYEKLQYRYFNSSDEFVNRNQYNYSPGYRSTYSLSANLQSSIGKYLNYDVSYSFSHEQEKNDEMYYRFDRYPELDYPLGWKPSTADSLFAVRDIENSHNSINYANTHRLNGGLSGRWSKFEFNTSVGIEFINEKIFFVRDTERHSPKRDVIDFSPSLNLKWKPVTGSEISFDYSSGVNRPPLEYEIPFTDKSDEITTVVKNNNLKTGWNNRFGMNARHFGKKRGDTYSMYANVSFINNDVVNTMLVDPATGKSVSSMVNVNGNYNFNFGANTEQPLDSARHWTFLARTSFRTSRRKSYTGTTDNGMGLSVMHSYSPYAGMSLKWRKDIWSIVLTGAYTGDIVRYDATDSYDQTGSTFEWNIQPMVDLPFGMKISGSFGLYGRRGYGDDMLNHDQWLWNMSVSQQFLKSKALTIRLDAVDILGQRTSEFVYVDNTERYYSSTKSYLSYVMLSAVYRFDIGKK